MKIISIFLTLIILCAFIPLSIANPTTDNYINEKAKYLNTKDWGKYSSIEGNFYIILDGEPYLVQTREGRIVEVKAGEPNNYDYKIITTTKNANKWWIIVTHYFETGKFTWKDKLTVMWLRLNTPIYEYGSGGNIAYTITNIKSTIIKVI